MPQCANTSYIGNPNDIKKPEQCSGFFMSVNLFIMANIAIAVMPVAEPAQRRAATMWQPASTKHRSTNPDI